MPQFLIERNIPGAGKLSSADLQAISQKSCAVLNTLGPQIQWVHSYVTDDQIHCVYRAPNAEMVREHARQGGFPADRVSEIRTMIDPTTAEQVAVAQARELNDRVTRSGRSGVPGDSSWLLNFLANEHSMNGAHAEAVTAAEAGARSRGGLTRAAHVYAALGDTPRALDMVEAASRERRPDVNFRCSITHRVLQGEPRMRELMRSSGFPAAN